MIDGAEDQQILWSPLYGLCQGVAEHIADHISEGDVFALLFALTGIRGISGQMDYPQPHAAS